jgi:hypothetical protein
LDLVAATRLRFWNKPSKCIVAEARQSSRPEHGPRGSWCQ